MEEIIDQVFFEIKNSGFEKKLIAGIVMTGGGSQLKHIDQLAEFTTGMATRIGYPNEHLAKDVVEEMASPMYATGIGLVIEGIIRFDIAKIREGNLNPDDNSSGNDKAKKRDKRRSKDSDGESGPSRFLQSLKNWFENDTSE
jgi:cell division protein FtsA